jgi:hypothetical protein
LIVRRTWVPFGLDFSQSQYPVSAAPSETTAPPIMTQPAAWNIAWDQLSFFQIAEITSNAAANM